LKEENQAICAVNINLEVPLTMAIQANNGNMKSVCFMSKTVHASLGANQAGTYPCFCSMKIKKSENLSRQNLNVFHTSSSKSNIKNSYWLLKTDHSLTASYVK